MDILLRLCRECQGIIWRVFFFFACVYNSDQFSFNYEMHSGRILTFKGTQDVYVLIQFTGAMTHSYTIQLSFNEWYFLSHSLYLYSRTTAGILQVREFSVQKILGNQCFLIEKLSLNTAKFPEIKLGKFFSKKMLALSCKISWNLGILERDFLLKLLFIFWSLTTVTLSAHRYKN